MIVNYFFLAIILLISVVSPSSGNSISGSILASKYSSSINDFQKSADFNLKILESGIDDPAFYNDALLYLVASGNFNDSFKLSKKMFDLDIRSPALGLVMIIEKISKEKINEGISLVNLFEKDLPPVLVASIRGWINLKKGKLEDSLFEFKKLSDTDLNFNLGAYYSAIAYSKSSKNEEALKIINKNNKNFKLLGKNFEILKSEIMIMNGQSFKVKETLKNSMRDFLNDTTLRELYRKINNNNLYYYQIFQDENNGISDTLLLFAQGESRQINQKLVEIFYCQLAYFLSKNNPRFKIKLAKALNEVGLFKESKQILLTISKHDIFYIESRLILADSFNENSFEVEAINILNNLIETQNNNFEIYELLGNIYRYHEKFELAEAAYSRGIYLAQNSEFETKNLWLLYFFRGIALEQLKIYDRSKQDLRQALFLMPDQPQVLNYLGYMLIEQKENLEEALEMIRKAVKISPQSGYIIDSLAWGLYQLGRYSEAIEPMEKAIELEPEDPIVNDHLGDILWKVGRKREAYFQWRKALIFNPKQELKFEIEKKIKLGLQ
ncbi:MAG: tetratricopeptide repeat protein [Paracoccaceae bacterium]